MTNILEERKPITEHLDELRRTIVRSIISLFAGFIACYFFSLQILDVLTKPIQNTNHTLHFFAPHDAFFVRIHVALLGGLILVSPMIIKEIWRFVSPGLHGSEKKKLGPWVLFSSFLFIIGCFFAFKVVLPIALTFLLGFEASFLEPTISITQYISFVSTLVIGFGVAFNLPIFMILLVLTNLVSVNTLRKFRKHIYVGIFILSMVLTPPDIVSQILLAVPMIGLIELGFLVAEKLQKNKAKTEVSSEE